MKTAENFEIEDEHAEFLKEMVEEYDLDDVSKALRVLLDYAMSDEADPATIFEQVRCERCD